MSRSSPVFIVTLGLGLALVGCSKGQSHGGRVNASATMAVRIVPAREDSVRRRVQAVGSLFAIDESTISSQVEGPVARVLVDVGDTVKEGQVLVSIEPTELQYAVEMQRAAVRQVRAQLGIGPNDPPPSDPTKVALVQRAAADLLDAKQKYDRATLLFQSQLIAQEQLDAAKAKYDNANAAHELAVQQVEQLAGQLQSSEATRRLADKKLGDASIRAPFPGSVKERKISPGEYLKVQSPVMVLVRTDQLRARLEVPEKWAAAVHLGTTVDIHVDAFPGEIFQGKLVRINPTVSTDSRSFEIEAKIVTIPGEALTYLYGTYKVFVVSGDHVVERVIKPGQQTETPQGVRVEVLEGLHAGERLAI